MAVDRGHADSKKSAGSKDNRQAKRNPHLGSALPDRQKQGAKERKVASDLADQGGLLARIAAADARRKGEGNTRYGLEVMACIIALRRDGKTWEQISQLGSVGQIKLPTRRQMSNLRDTNPELEEACKKARRDYERDIVEDGIDCIPKISRVKKLRPFEQVQAYDRHAARGLQLGKQALRSDYGEDADEDRQIIVMEVAGGWEPIATTSVDDADGQGVAAAAARERWKRIKKERGIG